MPPAAVRTLEGQTAVVTGSTSGIGRAVAVELARAGADVVVHGRHSREAAEGVAETVRRPGSKAQVVLADVADPGQQAALVDLAWGWKGRIDIWINNAGADVLTGDAARASFDEKLALLWRVDVLGTIGLSRLAGARMKAQGRGVILNIGWDGARRGMAGDSGQAFAAVKGAVMSFTLSLAQSLAPEVRVNCIAPGWIKTAWGENASEYWQSRAERESLAGRWGTPDDVARAARFLVSPEAEFIGGQVVDVNGGFRC